MSEVSLKSFPHRLWSTLESFQAGKSKRGEHFPLVFKAHRLLYHSTLGLRVIKKRRRRTLPALSGQGVMFDPLTGPKLRMPHVCPTVGAYRVTSLLRNRHPHRTTIGP